MTDWRPGKLHKLYKHSQTKHVTYQSYTQMLPRPGCRLLPLHMNSNVCVLMNVWKDSILTHHPTLGQSQGVCCYQPTIDPLAKRRAEQAARCRVILGNLYTERNGWREEGSLQQIPGRKSLGIITSHDYPSTVSYRASAEDESKER